MHLAEAFLGIPLTKKEIRAPAEQAFDVTIKANATAAFVWVETAYSGRWSDNGLLMTAGSSVTLKFFSNVLVRGPWITDWPPSILVD